MILFPTRNRSWALARFIEQYALTGATLPVCVIVDEDNLDHYEEVWKTSPSGWILFSNKKVGDLNGALNSAVEAFPNESFYGLVADDVVPLTHGWDVKLADACKPHYISWGNDTIWGEKLPTHPFIGGDLVRAFGWFSPPYTNRHCADFIWKDFADHLNLAHYCGDVTMKHKHWQTKEAEFDVTYATQPSPQEGHKQYHEMYKGSATFQDDIKRVKEKLGL